MPTLGLILARGGSKGLPGKNTRSLCGKPLIAWTIEAALQCAEIDRLILSTDDPEIANVADTWGCEVPFMRPSELAGDETPAIEVALHALDSLQNKYDLLVLLQPTSPLRLPADISACICACRQGGAPGCVSITKATESPYWMFTKTSEGELHNIIADKCIPLRRQALPTAYLINGAVYAARVDWLRQHTSFIGPGVRGHEMPAERAEDIDTLEDFEAAEKRLWHRLQN